MKSRLKHNAHGFTLLELLVAVAIFAVLSAMAYGGLSNVIDNSQQTETSMQRLQEIQLMLRIFTRAFMWSMLQTPLNQRQLSLLCRVVLEE